MKVIFFSWLFLFMPIGPFGILHIGPFLKICASILVVELFFHAYVHFLTETWPNSRCCYCVWLPGWCDLLHAGRMCWTCKEDLVCTERNREQLLGRFGDAADPRHCTTSGNYVHWQEWEQLAAERAYPEKLQGLNDKTSVSVWWKNRLFSLYPKIIALQVLRFDSSVCSFIRFVVWEQTETF